jgi:hypothetical protein
LRELIAQTAARHPETKIGLTGLPIMENDEMRASQSSMLWASVLSFVGVSLLFVAGFGGIRHALLANIVLLLGMAWAFGFVTLSVGHLNILSVSFTVTLIGIGIDLASLRRVTCNAWRGPGCEKHCSKRARGTAITLEQSPRRSRFCRWVDQLKGVAELGRSLAAGFCVRGRGILLPACIFGRRSIGACKCLTAGRPCGSPFLSALLIAASWHSLHWRRTQPPLVRQ